MMYRKQKNEKDVLYILDHLREFDKREVQRIQQILWQRLITR